MHTLYYELLVIRLHFNLLQASYKPAAKKYLAFWSLELQANSVDQLNCSTTNSTTKISIKIWPRIWQTSLRGYAINFKGA